MKTITFYSYKGGTGRTLVLANVAKYLARFNQKVFVIDFDLEAPGLHYKFNLGENGNSISINQGLVDYIYEYIQGIVPTSLKDYVVEATSSSVSGSTIHLLPAGNVPASDYWRKLSQISWHELFYSPSAKGVPLFLELQERIRKEYEPDFLLIDSRTGITEIGGVATSLLPDKVVCLVLSNIENLEGARAVLRSIKRAPRLKGIAPVEIVVALTRVPEMSGAEEQSIIQRTKDILNTEAENLSDTLSLQEVFILHSEPELQISEQLHVGNKSPDESILLRDYIRLFTNLIPKEILAPQIQALVNQAASTALDDPESTERDLETLTHTTGHPDSYSALLKFYRLRNASKEKLFKIAHRLWEITQRSEDPIIWDIVQKHFEETNNYYRKPDYPWQWIESIWRANGATDAKVGLALAKSFRSFELYERAVQISLDLLNNAPPTQEVVTITISNLRITKRWQEGHQLIKGFISKFGSNQSFLEECIEFLIAQNNKPAIKEFLDGIPISKLFSASIRTFDLLRILDRTAEAEEELLHYAERAAKSWDTSDLRDIGKIFNELGRYNEFINLVRNNAHVPKAEFDRFLNYLQREYK